MLNRDAFLHAQDIKTQDVPIPEMGDSIRLRNLTAEERFAVNDAAAAGGKFDPAIFQTTLIEFTAVTESGERLFQPGDAAMLARRSATVIDRIYTAAAKLNGLDAGAVDNAEKNSSADPSAASS